MMMAMPPAQRGYSPSVRARRLARILKKAREEAGFTQQAVAGTLGWSQAKVNMIETAKRRASLRDVTRVLDLYGIREGRRAEILDITQTADQRSWWSEYTDVFEGPFVALEDEAARIRLWSPHIVPGIVQEPAYARALFEASWPDDPAEVERRLRARMQRQAILTRSDPPEIHIVLDQTVIDRPIGGSAVLGEQLHRLVREAARPNVTVQVMPQGVAIHPGLDGDLIIFHMAEEGDPDVGYCEGHFGAVCLENRHKVNRCNVAFEQISEAALTPEESVALIEAAATTAR